MLHHASVPACVQGPGPSVQIVTWDFGPMFKSKQLKNLFMVEQRLWVKLCITP